MKKVRQFGPEVPGGLRRTSFSQNPTPTRTRKPKYGLNPSWKLRTTALTAIPMRAPMTRGKAFTAAPLRPPSSVPEDSTTHHKSPCFEYADRAVVVEGPEKVRCERRPPGSP